MSEMTELRREVPVLTDTEVLVAGGGLGGIAAALASARAGAKTVLIERNGYLGGVAAAGMCCSVYNCIFRGDGSEGVGGIPVEITGRLAQTGPGDGWRRHKGHIIYDVERAKLLFSEILEEAGVRVLTGLACSDVILERDRLRGVIVTGRRGLEAIRAEAVVDSTGDADIAALSGAPIKTRYGKTSYVFRLGGVDMDRFVDYFKRHPDQYPERMDVNWTFEEAMAQYDETGTFLFPHGGGIQLAAVREAMEEELLPREIGVQNTIGAMQMHGIRKLGVLHVITGYAPLHAMSAEEIAPTVTDGRRMAFAVAEFFRKKLPGFENAYVAATADDLGIRTSRYIDGEFLFTKQMKENETHFDDAVGRGVVERLVKLNTADGAWNAQVLGDCCYDIPLRCLLPRKIEGLIMGSGRSVSSEIPDLLRVMVMTMAVGQGAGTAAAVAVRQGVPVRNVDYEALKRELIRGGVPF